MRFLSLLVGAVCLVGPATASPITYIAYLNGANESPAVPSPGVGTAHVVLDLIANTLDVSVSFSGLLGNVTVSHIHCCTAVPGAGVIGVASPTPSFPGFPSGVTSGTYSNTFDLLLATSYNATFMNNNGGTPAGAAAALAAGLAGGRAYLNIHSNLYTGGEIRGFFTPVPEPASFLLAGAALAGIAALRLRRS